jgi:DNA-binding SARP family transcriptional activator
VRFEVLGPLRAAGGDGTPLHLPDGRARTVLALLCLSAGEPVTRERLIDAAWNGAPPATAATQVQGFVSVLRKTLGPAGQLIVTHGSGYLLNVPATDVDVHQMRQLRHAAAESRDRGQLQLAVDQLRAALALWRGRPFSGIACMELEAEADRIEQEQVSVVEDCASLELELGGHAALTGPLTDWAARFPLREGLRAVLITALLRSGRQAEAIAAYHDLRRSLADELGVDPSPALQDLYQRILSGDRKLMTPAAAPAAVVPSQLPGSVADFTGRSDQVTQLCAALTTGNPVAVNVCVISGSGGIGKSALAVQVAHLSSAAFPDGQLYVNLAGSSAQPASPGDVLSRLLRDLGGVRTDAATTEQGMAARYRSALAGRRMLLLLDDARDAAQVRPLLPGSGSCAVIVTTRAQLADLAGARPVNLEVMTPAEARLLFSGIVGSARAAAEPEAAERILRYCAGLPLAIRIAAAKLAARPQWSVQDMAARLAASHRRLTELQCGDLAVRASFQVSYESLPEVVAGAFRLLGWAGQPVFGPAAAAVLLGVSIPEAEQALEALVDAHMLTTPQPGRYRMHDLLRLFGAELAAARDGDEAVRRLLIWYSIALRSATDALAPGHPLPAGGLDPAARVLVPAFGGDRAALAWCALELDNLVWAIRKAAASGYHDLGFRMAAMFSRYAERAGNPGTFEVTRRLRLDSARALGDEQAEAWLLDGLGAALLRVGDFSQAIDCYQRSLDIYRRLGDRRGSAAAYNNLGTVYYYQRRYDAAREQFQLAEGSYQP